MRKKLPKWFTSSLEKNGCNKRNHGNPPICLAAAQPWPLIRWHLLNWSATAIVHRGLQGHHGSVEIWVVTWRKMHLSHIAFKLEFLISHRFRFSYYSWDDTVSYPSSLFVGNKRKRVFVFKNQDSLHQKLSVFLLQPIITCVIFHDFVWILDALSLRLIFKRWSSPLHLHASLDMNIWKSSTLEACRIMSDLDADFW